MRPRLHHLAGALVVLSLASPPETALAADPVVDGGLLYQWRLLPAGRPEPANPAFPTPSFGLVNQTIGHRVRYGSRSVGVNLVWSSDYTLRNVQFPGGVGKPTAISVSGGGYLRYQSRSFGINLGWSATPAVQWRLDEIEVTDARGNPAGGYMYRIYNTVARDYLVYCPRTFGINLVWSRDRSGGDCRSWWSKAAGKVAQIALSDAGKTTLGIVAQILYRGQLYSDVRG